MADYVRSCQTMAVFFPVRLRLCQDFDLAAAKLAVRYTHGVFRPGDRGMTIVTIDLSAILHDALCLHGGQDFLEAGDIGACDIVAY